MATLSTLFKSILFNSYDPYREPIKVRFTAAPDDRKLYRFTTKFVDGFSKVLCCQVIAALVDHLAPCTRVGCASLS